MMNEIFTPRDEPLVKKIIFINGITRTGKFFLGKIISGLKDIDYFQYVSVLEHVPFMQRLGCIDEKAAISLMQVQADEHIYNMRVGRSLNLRFDDASSIYNSLIVNEYLTRSLTPLSEEFIDDIKNKNTMPLFILHHSLPNINIFFKTFPDIKWINLIRHPIDIIHSWHLRGWGRRAASDPFSFELVIKGPGQPVPCYAYEWEAEYEKSSEMDRIIKSINRLTGMCTQSYYSLTNKQKQRILSVRYENMVEHTHREIESLCSFLGTEPSEGMPVILARERCPKEISLERRKQKMEDIRGVASKEAFELMMHLACEYEGKENPYQS